LSQFLLTQPRSQTPIRDARRPAQRTTRQRARRRNGSQSGPSACQTPANSIVASIADRIRRVHHHCQELPIHGKSAGRVVAASVWNLQVKEEYPFMRKDHVKICGLRGGLFHAQSERRSSLRMERFSSELAQRQVSMSKVAKFSTVLVATCARIRAVVFVRPNQ